MIFCKKLSSISLFITLISLIATFGVSAQERPRIVRSASDLVRPIEQDEPAEKNENNEVEVSKGRQFPYSPNVQKKATYNQEIVIVGQNQNISTGAAKPAAPEKKYKYNLSGNLINQRLLSAIQARIGTPYRYGSEGPNTFDCSGLVWSVFQSAGISFERGSARSFWQRFEPVSNDEKYKFGTLVFFNGLGHMGIVADEKGFYHASSSKGVTYSPFAGYWEKRLVGFRRIPYNAN